MINCFYEEKEYQKNNTPEPRCLFFHQQARSYFIYWKGHKFARTTPFIFHELGRITSKWKNRIASSRSNRHFVEYYGFRNRSAYPRIGIDKKISPKIQHSNAR